MAVPQEPAAAQLEALANPTPPPPAVRQPQRHRSRKGGSESTRTVKRGYSKFYVFSLSLGSCPKGGGYSKNYWMDMCRWDSETLCLY